VFSPTLLFKTIKNFRKICKATNILNFTKTIKTRTFEHFYKTGSFYFKWSCSTSNSHIYSTVQCALGGGPSWSVILRLLGRPRPPPPPPCAQGGGRERPVSNTIRKHRWASSLSSFYSEFFVEKWSTKSSITRSSWYVVPSTPCENAPRRSLLTAKSAFHVREKSYSIAMEVTCHLPGPFQQEGLNFSSWRAPQEAPDWLFSL
jgi:hypothetical protein